MASTESTVWDGAEGPPDTDLASFITLLKFLSVPADPAQLRHQLGKGGQPADLDDLLRLAKFLKVKARAVTTSFGRLEKLPLPAIAEAKDGTFFILARAGEGAALIQSPLEQRPRKLTAEELEEMWSCRLLLMTTRAQMVGDARKFDVTWFIPALVKYRGLLGEVVLASFFLQIFALVTPLFFQVVIGKVLVHKGLTTLDVMVIGLVVVSVFEVLMGALRTYVFSHTTNRVDVELGSRLFRHLMGLPLAYFEVRRVGDSVARVRELENIRDFLTSSSVTLFIDLMFTVVFLAVMYLYSPFLTLIVVLSLPLYVIISLVVTPPLRAGLDDKFRRGAEKPGLSGGIRHRRADAQIHGRGAADAAALGEAACGLRHLQLPGQHARQCGQP